VTYNANLRGSCGQEMLGGAHRAATDRRSTECDNDCDPEREEEEQSGQEGCQGGCGDRRHDIGRERRAGTRAGEAAAVSGVRLHERT
jgi:hypothetical protein